jgi:hypothetical protein
MEQIIYGDENIGCGKLAKDMTSEEARDYLKLSTKGPVIGGMCHERRSALYQRMEEEGLKLRKPRLK